MSISRLVFETFYIYAPAMVANMAPVLAHKMNLLLWLDRPVNKRLLGLHKTIRGFAVGICAGAVTAALISFITDAFMYESLGSAIIFGAAIGFGALLGDAVKSFFKRWIHIESGKSWIPFDQIDFVLGATLVGLFFIHISFVVVTFALVAIGFASYIVSVVGVALHIKRSL